MKRSLQLLCLGCFMVLLNTVFFTIVSAQPKVDLIIDPYVQVISIDSTPTRIVFNR